MRILKNCVWRVHEVAARVVWMWVITWSGLGSLFREPRQFPLHRSPCGHYSGNDVSYSIRIFRLSVHVSCRVHHNTPGWMLLHASTARIQEVVEFSLYCGKFTQVFAEDTCGGNMSAIYSKSVLRAYESFVSSNRVQSMKSRYVWLSCSISSLEMNAGLVAGELLSSPALAEPFGVCIIRRRYLSSSTITRPLRGYMSSTNTGRVAGKILQRTAPVLEVRLPTPFSFRRDREFWSHTYSIDPIPCPLKSVWLFPPVDKCQLPSAFITY